jgi:hypothetical protein
VAEPGECRIDEIRRVLRRRGYTWPIGREPSLGILTGTMSRDIEAGEVIREIFVTHRRGDVRSAP